jgi:hypothetical protein
MEILTQKRCAEYYEEEQDRMLREEWEIGVIYYILRCYSCHNVTFYEFSIYTGVDPEYMDRSSDRILYPCENDPPIGLPTSIQAEWDAAIRVRRINQNAFAVLLGRVLDAICLHQKAEGKYANDRIEYLASSGQLPQSLKDVAHGLRQLRNFGAHGNLGELDAKDAPLLESLCRALLMYLYTVPALAQDAQKRLERR